MAGERRIEEREAFEVICALEDVERHDWLSTGNKPTPDLEVTIDGDLVTVEITMHTVGQELWGAAEKMRSPKRSGCWPQRICELSRKWTVIVGDSRVESRDPSRRLTELIEAMVPALVIIESAGATPEVMRQRANEQFGRYWYPPDIDDWVTKGTDPRSVMVVGSPSAVHAGCGGVTVYVSAGQGCFLEAVDDLVPAVQDAINRKAARGQMANVTGKKWLVVALDGGSASMQLEELCSRATHPPDSGVDSVMFPDFHEVWAFARTFDGTRHAVLRLSRSDPSLCFTVPRTVNESHT